MEGVTCTRTQQQVKAFQQATIDELPVVMILHLKCFDFKDDCKKILKPVKFPIEFTLDQSKTSYISNLLSTNFPLPLSDIEILASKNKYQPKQKQYKLFAIVYHDGKEATKGHYVTDTWHGGYSTWIRFDDSTVKPVSEFNVLNPKSPRVPYLLYYRNNHQTK